MPLSRPFQAVAALSGGLVGTGEVGGPSLAELSGRSAERFDYDGQLTVVPILLGCHEQDLRIPLAKGAPER